MLLLPLRCTTRSLCRDVIGSHASFCLYVCGVMFVRLLAVLFRVIALSGTIGPLATARPESTLLPLDNKRSQLAKKL